MPLSQMALQRMGTFPMQKGRSLIGWQSATYVAVCGTLPQIEEMELLLMHTRMHALQLDICSEPGASLLCGQYTRHAIQAGFQRLLPAGQSSPCIDLLGQTTCRVLCVMPEKRTILRSYCDA